MIEYNEEINAKALEKIRIQKRNQEYLRNCVRAEICPDCGEDLRPQRYQNSATIECGNCGARHTEIYC